MRNKASIALATFAMIVAFDGAGAQQRGTARVPNFLAVSFRSPDEPKLGAEVAEGVRQRMLRTFPMPPKTLRVLTREEINNTLMVSGFGADTVVSLIDLGILSKQMGAEETMEGSAKRTAQGVEVSARFYFGGNIAAPEVLSVVTEKNAEAAGRKVAELYIQARKELPAYERCKNALIQNDADQAIAAAQESMQQYPQGVLPRACLLTAYGAQYKKYPADSIIRLGNEIVAIDPENPIAIAQLVDAYATKQDTAKVFEFISRLDALNPTDVQQGASLISILMNFGAPDRALKIANQLLQANPGEPSILEQKWKILQTTNQWKAAIAAGEEMVKFEPAKADTVFFRRQIGAAFQDSQPQLALQYMARVTTKFPNDVLLQQAYMAELRRQGQTAQALEVAKKVVALDRTNGRANGTVVALYAELGQTDSAVTFAKGALTGADSTTRAQIGTGLLTLIGPALSIAQKDTAATPDVARANWTKVYGLSASVDSIVPQAYTAFYMSYAAYQLASNAASRVQPLAQARNNAAACTELNTARDMVLAVDLNMARGGSVDRESAAAILRAASQLRPYVNDTALRTQIRCR